MIDVMAYLEGRDAQYPITDEEFDNAETLCEKLAELENEYGEDLILTSGYRPKAINEAIPGSKSCDQHTTCEAVDLRDTGGHLSNWILDNIEILEALNLYMESPKSAKNHVHLQLRPPKSGKRIFLA